MILISSLTSVFANWYIYQEIFPSNPSENDRFGSAVSISGEHAVVGTGDTQHTYAYSAYVFARNGYTWTEQIELSPECETAYFFGDDVSIDGDYIIVGASGSVVPETESGAAFVFHLVDGDWIEQAMLNPSDGMYNNHFGSAVRILGDTAIVGARGVGSAYVFLREDDTWTEQAILTANSNESIAFGYSVDFSDDYAIIAAPFDLELSVRRGSVYFYRRDGNDWTEQTRIVNSDTTAETYFGHSVSISGSYAIVGALLSNYLGYYSGAAYIFHNDGSGWVEQERLLASDGASFDYFGCSVCISGDYALVGARIDNGDQEYAGAVYIFHREGDTWIEAGKLVAQNADRRDAFGCSIDFSDGYAIFGANRVSDCQSDGGAAYMVLNDEIGIDDENLPEVTAAVLHGAYPNPFNPSTTIAFSLPEPGDVQLDIYNIRGEKVRTLLSEHRDSGKHLVPWDGSNEKGGAVASGIYFARLITGNREDTCKLLLLK